MIIAEGRSPQSETAFPRLARILFLALPLLGAWTISSASSAGTGWDGRIVIPGHDQALTATELYSELSQADVLVIGEKHYTAAVQNMEAQIIRGVVTNGAHQSGFTLGWEFLNRSERSQIDALFDQVRAGNLSVEAFVQQTQQTANAAVYAPVIAAVRDLGGSLVPTNLSRAEKSPVTQGGIGALDPALLPPSYSAGGENYRQRFVEAMGDHVPPHKVANYFDAQCLTDDVMAWSLQEGDGLKILIAGAFHTDYRDGAVARLRERQPEKIIKTVTIVDAADFSATELPSVLVDERWGEIADYVVFVNEPTTSGRRGHATLGF